MYYSQAGQDKWVHEIIGNKGFFVDVGAYDGIQTSNTYALELAGWEGICIEGNHTVFKQLVNNRNCINVHMAVTDYTGDCTFGSDRIGGSDFVYCDTLDNILADSYCPREIDYMSLDIEGQELIALSSLNFDYWDIKLMTVEHNLYCDGPDKKNALFKLLTEKGYTRVKDNIRCLDMNPLYFNVPFEDWYAKNGFL